MPEGKVETYIKLLFKQISLELDAVLEDVAGGNGRAGNDIEAEYADVVRAKRLLEEELLGAEDASEALQRLVQKGRMLCSGERLRKRTTR